jgi:hypothetical protein
VHAAPRWDGQRFDWSAWDRRYAPLLDGSAFADLPRAGVPVEAFYLPLNENWPIPIDEGFTGGYWAPQAMRDDYRRRFIEASRRVAEHLRERGWHDTFFEFYLNNKVYHKKDRWDRSSAPWVFDEPTNTQDFVALRWWASAFHAGVAGTRGEAKVVFRADISRPQWQRDLLDGLLDVNVVSGAVRDYPRLVLDRKQADGQVVYMYGSTNGVDGSNLQPVAWCLEAWCRGLDGVLPWQTVGNAESWKRGDALSLFYPAAAIDRPGDVVLPSVRLKAYRRGQQDVEYLTLLTQALGEPRWAVGRAVLERLGTTGRFEQAHAEDAGRLTYDTLTPEQLWRLRMDVAGMLEGRQLPASRRLVKWRMPPRRQWGEPPPPPEEVAGLGTAGP